MLTNLKQMQSPESTANAEPASNAKALAGTEKSNSTMADEVKPTKRRSSKTAASKRTTDSKLTANSKSTETKANNKKATTSKTKTSSKSATKKQSKEADAESINNATVAASTASVNMDQAESLVTSEAKFSANDTVDNVSKPNEVAETKGSTEATANATVVKRKRGRKPKASISTATESKAKTETVTVPENVTKDNPVTVTKPVSEVKAIAEDKPKTKRGRKPKSDTQNKISADEMATDTAALDSDASDESKSVKQKSPFKKPYRRTKKVFANMSLEQMAQITPIDSVKKPAYDDSEKPFIPAIVWADSL